jgi:hypothetical protein
MTTGLETFEFRGPDKVVALTGTIAKVQYGRTPADGAGGAGFAGPTRVDRAR